MKVASATSTTRAAAHGSAREVEPRKTSVSRADLKSAITNALTKLNGSAPSQNLVDTLTAQASLETASGQSMYNFNFGGIKGASPSGNTALLKTHEVLDGKDVVIKDGFRAYNSLDEGALDYVKTMRDRFGSALAPAAAGDTAGFAHALKKAGYYTASESDYAKGISRLMGQPEGVRSRTASLSISSEPVATASSQSVTRIEDILDADRFAMPSMSTGNPRHHAEDDDDD